MIFAYIKHICLVELCRFSYTMSSDRVLTRFKKPNEFRVLVVNFARAIKVLIKLIALQYISQVVF